MNSLNLYKNISPTEAIALQKELRAKIKLEPLQKTIRLIGGADISFNKYEETVYAGIVVLSYPDLTLVDKIPVITTAYFPYISGLLAFREIPALLLAWNQLKTKPDIMMMDGHGIAHQRRMGIATHFGLLTNEPTLGCAKSRLTGTFAEPENKVFAENPLMDKEEQIGVVLRTKKNCKPVFVSPGNKITQQEAVEIVKNCTTKYRIPEPTRLAHLFVNEIRINNSQNRNRLL